MRVLAVMSLVEVELVGSYTYGEYSISLKSR